MHQHIDNGAGAGQLDGTEHDAAAQLDSGAGGRTVRRVKTTLPLDHVLIALKNLDRAARTFSDDLGFTLTPEGMHPGRGTHNRLIVFGPEYLELIAVRDPAEAAVRPSMTGFLESREGLYMFALGTDDIDGAVASLRSRGVAIEEPVDGARRNGDGSTAYTWRSAAVSSEATPGCETFIIQHHRTAAERYTEPTEPFKHPNGAVGVDHLAIAVHDAEAAASRWQRAFGLRVRPEDKVDSLVKTRFEQVPAI